MGCLGSTAKILHPTLGIKNVNFVYNIVQNFSRRTPHPTSDKNPTLGGSFSCSLLNTPIVHPTLGIKNVNFVYNIVQNFSRRTPHPTSDKNPTLGGSFSCSLLNTPILHPTLGGPTLGGSTVVGHVPTYYGRRLGRVGKSMALPITLLSQWN